MNNQELILTTPFVTLLVGVTILSIFAGYFFATFLMKKTVNHLISENNIYKDYLTNIGSKVKNFQKKPVIAFHGILTEIQSMTKQFIK